MLARSPAKANQGRLGDDPELRGREGLGSSTELLRSINLMENVTGEPGYCLATKFILLGLCMELRIRGFFWITYWLRLFERFSLSNILIISTLQ